MVSPRPPCQVSIVIMTAITATAMITIKIITVVAVLI